MGVFDRLFGKKAMSETDTKQMKERHDIQGLIRALKHEDLEIRLSAAENLALVGDWRMAEPLLGFFRHDQHTLVLRWTSAVKLALEKNDVLTFDGSEPAETVDALMRGLTDARSQVADVALYIVGAARRNESLLPSLLRLLKKQEKNTAALSHVRKAVTAVGSAAVQPLIEVLRTDVDPLEREKAVSILGGLEGEPARDAVIAALEDEDGGVRRVASAGLLSKADAELLATIAGVAIGDLTHEEWTVRVAATAVLAKTGDKRARDLLQEVAASDPEPVVREAASIELEKLLQRKEEAVAYEAQMRDLAKKLISEHGDLAEVRCVSGHNPCHIELVFSDGEEIVVGEHSGHVDISLLKAGYHGTGSRCFHAFLDEAGFSETFEQVVNMKDGTVLRC